jgi:hypothetical protein
MKAAPKASLVLLALLATLPAAAQSTYERHNEHASREGRMVYAPQRLCQRLCTTDTTPCDPLKYKDADGRCNLQSMALHEPLMKGGRHTGPIPAGSRDRI